MVKKTANIATPIKTSEPITKKEELRVAKYQLTKFITNRKEAKTVKEYEEADFWVSHWQTVVNNLTK